MAQGFRVRFRIKSTQYRNRVEIDSIPCLTLEVLYIQYSRVKQSTIQYSNSTVTIQYSTVDLQQSRGMRMVVDGGGWWWMVVESDDDLLCCAYTLVPS